MSRAPRVRRVPPDFTFELPDGTPLGFQHLFPGTFRMGQRGKNPAEEPVHLVRITHEFFLGQFPVTQAQFATWTGSRAYKTWLAGPGKALGELRHANGIAGADKASHPAETLSWHAATAFCDWLTAECAAQFPAGISAARLPTEAQWEYACRAGTETQYHTGDSEAALAAAGWYDANSEHTTHPVGLKTPNAWGLYDLHGNVDEWCRDAWDEHSYKKRPSGVSDPEIIAPENLQRMVRSASWIYSAGYCRAASRYGSTPGNRRWHTGLRVCLAPGPGQAQPSGATSPDKRAEAPPATGDGRRGTSLKSDGAGGAAAGAPTRRDHPSSRGRKKPA